MIQSFCATDASPASSSPQVIVDTPHPIGVKLRKSGDSQGGI